MGRLTRQTPGRTWPRLDAEEVRHPQHEGEGQRQRVAGLSPEHLWDARVYREMRQERIEPQDATRMTYVLTQIAKIIQAAELEARIEAVERALGTRRS